MRKFRGIVSSFKDRCPTRRGIVGLDVIADGFEIARRLALGAPIETPGRDFALAARIVDQEK